MQILVSDYDGTLNPFYFKPIFEQNIEGIKDFRANGNLFIISTARKPEQITGEIKRFDIPYDYLICSNGNIILDSNLNAIYINNIADYEITPFLDIISFLYGVKTIEYYDYKGEATFQSPYKIEVETDKFIKSRNFANFEYGMKIEAFLRKISISHSSNKREGMITLLKKLSVKIKDSDIYSIGNSTSDIDMLKRFNGYKVPYSNPYLLFDKSIPMIDSVYSLTKRIKQ